MSKLKYQMLIQWSDEDDCFLVGFPDFPGQCWRTHGDTYELAVANAIEALESLTLFYYSHESIINYQEFNLARVFNWVQERLPPRSPW